jgi:formylmethanofuran dehydrogenase subunit D
MAEVLTIVTFKDIFQDEAEMISKYSDEYRNLSAQIILDKQDMANLGLKDGQNVQITNDVGGVVVSVKATDDDPHPGLAFMVDSPWSCQLLKDDFCMSDSPESKGISATVSPSKDSVTQISEIFSKIKSHGA